MYWTNGNLNLDKFYTNQTQSICDFCVTFVKNLDEMLIIGIAGGTGSGKTTVVDQIISGLSDDEVGVISQDDYYKNNDHLCMADRCLINFDHPDSIDFELLTRHLTELKQNKNIQRPVYSFVDHNRLPEEIPISPKKVLIVEGILILTNEKLRDLMDIKVFVQADSDERLIRRLKRDMAERGRSMSEVLNRYQTTLKPMHEQFIEPSKEFADIIIPNDKYNSVGVEIIRTFINKKLSKL